MESTIPPPACQEQPPHQEEHHNDDEYDDDDEEEEEDFRLPGTWLEGDSLAPPCESELDIIDGLIELAQITSTEVS